MKCSKSPKSFCSRGGGDRIAEGMDFADFLVAKKDEILSVAARHGATVADIAGRLFLSEGTVRNYLSSAMQKLGAGSRTEAVRTARDHGWL